MPMEPKFVMDGVCARVGPGANLQTLCRACHFKKTGAENEKVKGRTEWGRRQRLIQGGKP